MNGHRPTFEEIDGLTKLIKAIFAGLEMQVARIDDHFRSAELDFMYGNITEKRYLERLNQIGDEIEKFKIKMSKLQELDIEAS